MAASIKIGFALIITATAIFNQPVRSEMVSPVRLATLDMVAESKPKSKAISLKNTPNISVRPINEKSQTNTFSIKKNELKKKKWGQSQRKIKISGYRGQTYVYGEVISSKNGKLEGFIYHPGNGMTYVYGKKKNKTITLYDSSGNLYQMKPE